MTVRCPADLRALPADRLPELAAQLRDVLVDVVPRTGGHLGPNLGVVELTLALHRVFESPRDPLVWDTGHQAYVHKMLTGRAAAMGGLRSDGGLSGYPSRAESVHDLVENSHASTSLAYADGLAAAFALRGEDDRTVVAVVGDGALTGGMAWEALNNCARTPRRPLVVVLNDNERSYAPTVGGLAEHLARLRAGDAPSVFEQLGLGYLGPVDGHDVGALEAALRHARRSRRTVVVHCVTRKGEGYAPALADDVDRMHAVSAPAPSDRPSWTSVFGAELAAVAAVRDDVVALSAAMVAPTGLDRLAAVAPERVRDVGIAEQQAVTSAAGLAMGGMHPVVALYATFLNRAFDSTLLDVGLHRLPVTLVLDRAGVTGPDGPSHHGLWDLALLAMVPGMRVAAPRDATRLRELLREALDTAGPTALRYPKGCTPPDLEGTGRLGQADVLVAGDGAQVLVLATGPSAHAAVEAARRLPGFGVTVVDPRWVLPLDPEVIAAAARHRLVVTVEDGGAVGGFGDAVARALAGSDARVVPLAVRQEFVRHAERDVLLAEHGLDADGIVAAVLTSQPKRRARRRYVPGAAPASRAGIVSQRGSSLRGLPDSSESTTTRATRSALLGRGNRRS
ncbi:1-deoxy-D-xylulose-5-phosphate synthase [Motilibacter peucedani]|uniref:1-deoxy-D-xylulose-5-phosphate synthase n=1 Tax=Motilibacter peucedani TaxID=598650 RepID=A0A420XK37_9ACTN|nr:1-deoxy-D-xylulose-5-phosphate synthase [Motilibacter peucedani]RKS67993.1 1-deoxy-D-xylulose-5-phosphate synthase [Motilibacter peucedani]